MTQNEEIKQLVEAGPTDDPNFGVADKYFKIAMKNILKGLPVSSLTFKELRNHSWSYSKKNNDQIENLTAFLRSFRELRS